MESGELRQLSARLATVLGSFLDADKNQMIVSGGTRLAAEEALARYVDGRPELIAGLLRACHGILRTHRGVHGPLPAHQAGPLTEMREIVDLVANYAFVAAGKTSPLGGKKVPRLG